MRRRSFKILGNEIIEESGFYFLYRYSIIQNPIRHKMFLSGDIIGYLMED